MREKCARLILDWHVHFGSEKARHIWPRETEVKYLHVLERFREQYSRSLPDLTDEIARCQISGIFEKFFGERVPASMLAEHGIEQLTFVEVGATLGELARLILQRDSSEDAQDETAASRLLELPPRWDQEPTQLAAGSKGVRANGIEDAVKREYGEVFGKLQVHDLGGLKLMSALHESVVANSPKSEAYELKKDGIVTILSPASFNLQLASGTGTLVGAMISGRIKVGRVIAGVKPDWAIEPRKES